MKKLLSVFSILICAMLLFAACGDQTDGGDDNTPAIKLVIYMSSLNTKAPDDEKHSRAIEEKYYKDTGIKIDLDVRLYTVEDLSTKVTLALSEKSQIDGICMHIGEDTGVNTFIRQDIAMELDELLEAYGPNILNVIDDRYFNSLRLNGHIYGIPSIQHSKDKAILVRKDWREAAGLPRPTTIAEFTQMLEAFKQRGSTVVPMVGQPWEIEDAFAGSFNTYPYHAYVYNSEGQLIPGSLHENRGALLKQLYDWASAGLWDPDNWNRQSESVINLMVNNRAGVYVFSPYLGYLIQIMRKVNLENPDAEWEVYTSLNGPTGETLGYYAVPESQDGFIIPKSSRNAATVIKYFNWMYASPENYELCAYGIKGEHWIDEGEGLRGFPAGKENLFLTNPPITGSFKFLNNILMSDRLLTVYTEEEVEIINQVRSAKVYSDLATGWLLPSISDKQASSDYVAAMDLLKSEVNSLAWAGLGNPLSIHSGSGKTKNQYYIDLVYTNGASYLNLLDTNFKRVVSEYEGR